MEEKKESKKEKKLSLREVLDNAFYALKLGISFSKKIFQGGNQRYELRLLLIGIHEEYRGKSGQR